MKYFANLKLLTKAIQEYEKIQENRSRCTGHT